MAKSYAKIKTYSDDLTCAFEDCMEIYKLYLEKKSLNKYPSIFVNRDILETLPKIHQNLLIFKIQIKHFYRILKKLSLKKW